MRRRHSLIHEKEQYSFIDTKSGIDIFNASNQIIIGCFGTLDEIFNFCYSMVACYIHIILLYWVSIRILSTIILKTTKWNDINWWIVKDSWCNEVVNSFCIWHREFPIDLIINLSIMDFVLCVISIICITHFVQII